MIERRPSPRPSIDHTLSLLRMQRLSCSIRTSPPGRAGTGLETPNAAVRDASKEQGTRICPPCSISQKLLGTENALSEAWISGLSSVHSAEDLLGRHSQETEEDAEC